LYLTPLSIDMALDTSSEDRTPAEAPVATKATTPKAAPTKAAPVEDETPTK